MKKLTNKGFSLKEFMMGLLFFIVISLIIFKVFTDNKDKNYTSVKVTGSNFADAVMIYKDKYYKGDSIYYLYEVLSAKYIDEIKDPIERKVFCDKYNSYVELRNNHQEKHVHLLCGNKLIVGIQNGAYNIYEVTNWQDSKENTNDVATLYNYKVNGVEALEKYCTLEELIERFNSKEGRYFRSLEDIKKDKRYQVLSKEMYRTKTLVKELN